MKSTERILKEYRDADFEKRLNLFLECPSLRNQFIEIDQGEVSGGALSEIQHQKKSNMCWFKRVSERAF